MATTRADICSLGLASFRMLQIIHGFAIKRFDEEALQAGCQFWN